MQEQGKRIMSWIGSDTHAKHVGLGCGALILVCGLCSLAVAAASNSTNTPTAAAQSTNTTSVTQAAQVTNTPAATATQAAPTATPKPKAWVTVEHFTGSANQQTPTFTTPDGSRIVWSASANNEFGGSFSITSYGSDGSYGDLIANTSTPPKVSGTFNVHGAADIYLKIDTYGCTYDIAVQVYR